MSTLPPPPTPPFRSSNRSDSIATRLVLRTAGLCLVAALVTACGGGTSSASDVPVGVQPPAPASAATIVNQPTDVQVSDGATATFEVTASGSALTYQWQRSTDGGATWLDMANATSARLSLTGHLSDNGTQYRVQVGNGLSSAPSTAAQLKVSAGTQMPSITVDLAPLTLTVGTQGSFSITADGTGLSYLWQTSTNGTDWADISSASGPTYLLPPVDLKQNGQQFRVLVRNEVGTVTSSAVQLQVTAATAAPTLVTEPEAQGVTAPAAATFNVQATGTPAPTLQWQVSRDQGATYSNVAGTVGASLTTAATQLSDSGSLYRVVASNASGSTTSRSVALTVTSGAVAPSFTTQPADVSVAAGQNVGLSVSAGGNPNPALQWQISADAGATWTSINGANASSYSFVAASGDNGRRFRVVASNSQGRVVSRDATVSVAVQSTGPLASAAGPYSALVGAAITLDGTGSSSGLSGKSGKRLNFTWTVLAAPDGSRASLQNATTANPSFATDTAGNYTIQLVVSNAEGATATATTSIVTAGQACSQPGTLGTQALAQTNNCLACHAADRTLVGPSFKAIAARYRYACDANAQLSARIVGGGVGVWGPIPMPANPQISAADAQALANYILAH